MDTIKRILTGIRPTGALHVGHYAGALKQWLALQDGYECFFMVADIQALTTHIDQPKKIEDSVLEVMLDWIGVGLNPEKPNVHFILQSGVYELNELTTYFSMLVPFTEIEHNPTIKEEKKQQKSSVTAGFMIYPISQAADILLFSPSPANKENRLLVPVGEDQIPHLEETNRIARRFNERYGATFIECKPLVGEVGRLPGTDGSNKMSKSLNNAIMLKDDETTVAGIVKKMFTDKTKLRKNDPGHPERCPVYLYHQTFGDLSTLKERCDSCKSGRLGCVDCKKDLIIALNIFLSPIRNRRAAADKNLLKEYLIDGTKKAREIGQQTMQTVRDAMHLNYPSILG